jgi:hypothetical protein
MTKNGKRELLVWLRAQYVKARKVEKGRILDQFVLATGYHRKYAIDLLKHGPPTRTKQKRGSRRRYGLDVVAGLAQVWKASGHLCGKRLQPFLPEMVAVLERHHELHLAPATRDKLLQMSAATMDRALKPARARLPQRGRSTTKPGSLLKKAIAIRTFGDWNERQPGFVEADLVAHWGETTAGEYLNTLCVVDIHTRWHEPVALPNKGQKATFEGLLLTRQRLPFPLLGFDSDNGSEFINTHLFDYCLTEHILFTRARPYVKNHQAHVEQRNWSVIRQTVGYDRYESPQALALLAATYADLRLLVNFFQPVMKLAAKTRVGSKVHKKYDTAQTPYQRILACPDIDPLVKDQLRQLYLSLNPLALRRRMQRNLDKLWALQR